MLEEAKTKDATIAKQANEITGLREQVNKIKAAKVGQRISTPTSTSSTTQSFEVINESQASG